MFAPAAGTNMDIIFSYLGHCIPPVIIAAAILFFLRRKKHLRAVTAVLAPVSFIGALVFGVFHFGVPIMSTIRPIPPRSMKMNTSIRKRQSWFSLKKSEI